MLSHYQYFCQLVKPLSAFSNLQCRVDGFAYVGAGNSTSKKDAQANAANDFIQFLVREGKVQQSEVPVVLVTY